MTHREGNMPIIEPEAPQPCHECGKVEETRPYGPMNKRLCFDCATSPKYKAIVEKNLQAMFDRTDGAKIGSELFMTYERNAVRRSCGTCRHAHICDDVQNPMPGGCDKYEPEGRKTDAVEHEKG